jgi:hypothetical protein
MGTNEIDGVKFVIGEKICLSTGKEVEGIVRGIIFRQGCVTYEIMSGEGLISEYYDFELETLNDSKI